MNKFAISLLLGLTIAFGVVFQHQSDRPRNAWIDSTESQPRSAGAQIGNGHAWSKHRSEFPWIKTQAEFIALIDSITAHPSLSKKLSNGRAAYWDATTGTIVITDSRTADGGTMFRPSDGVNYYYRQR